MNHHQNWLIKILSAPTGDSQILLLPPDKPFNARRRRSGAGRWTQVDEICVCPKNNHTDVNFYTHIQYMDVDYFRFRWIYIYISDDICYFCSIIHNLNLLFAPTKNWTSRASKWPSFEINPTRGSWWNPHETHGGYPLNSKFKIQNPWTLRG